MQKGTLLRTYLDVSTPLPLVHLPPKSMETIGLNVHLARPLSEAVQFLKEILARISKLT